MKRASFVVMIILVLSFFGCKNDRTSDYMTNQKAATYFVQVEEICSSDKKSLWETNLYGPILIINPETRAIYSNFQDSDGLLKPRDGIYTGTYPKEMVISNTAVSYGNTLFAMVRLRSEEDEYEIKSRCLHSLFHCYQVKKEIDTPDYHASHLGDRTARLWVKLEWRALQRAIRTSGEIRTQAIRDALVFRSARREMYPLFISEENYFENYEGITTFTYTYMCSDSHDEYVRNLLGYYDRIYNSRSYPYSWGFINGALYAHLLHESGFDFIANIDRESDLGEMTKEQYKINLPEISRDIAGSLAFNYDIDLINLEEQDREVKLKEGLWKSVSKYIDKPVVFLELESPNFSFEPDDMTPVDTLGTIYNSLRISDNWGKIDVEDGGCLVSPNLDFIRVPARNINSDKNHISGDGWLLILNSSWELVEYDENYYVRKLIP